MNKTIKDQQLQRTDYLVSRVHTTGYNPHLLILDSVPQRKKFTLCLKLTLSESSQMLYSEITSHVKEWEGAVDQQPETRGQMHGN